MESSDDEGNLSGDMFAQGVQQKKPHSPGPKPTSDATGYDKLQGNLVKPFSGMEITALSPVGSAGADVPPIVHLHSDLSSEAFQPDNQEGLMGYLNATAGGGYGNLKEKGADAATSASVRRKSEGNGDYGPVRPGGSVYRFIPLSQKEPQRLIDADPITVHAGATINNERFLDGMACSLTLGDKCRFCCEGRFDWLGFISRIDSRDPDHTVYYGDFSKLPHFVASWNEKPYPRHKISKFFVPEDTTALDSCLVRGHPLTGILSNRHRMKKGIVVQLCDGSTGIVNYNDPTCWRIGVKFDDASRIVHRMTYLKVKAINPTQNYLANYSAELAVEKMTPTGRKRTLEGFQSDGSGKSAKTPKTKTSITPSSAKAPKPITSKKPTQRARKSLDSSAGVGDSRPWATSSQPMGERAPQRGGLTWIEQKRLECHNAVQGVLNEAKSKGSSSAQKKEVVRERNQSGGVAENEEVMDVEVDNVDQGMVQVQKDKDAKDWAQKLSDLRKMADETITRPLIAAMVAHSAANPAASMRTPPQPRSLPPSAPTKSKMHLTFDSTAKEPRDKQLVQPPMETVQRSGDNGDVIEKEIVKKRPTHSAISGDSVGGAGAGTEPLRNSDEVIIVSSECSIVINSTQPSLEQKDTNISSGGSSSSLLQLSSSASHGYNAKEGDAPTVFSQIAVEHGRFQRPGAKVHHVTPGHDLNKELGGSAQPGPQQMPTAPEMDKESGGSAQPGPQQMPAAPEMDKESGGSVQPGPQQIPAAPEMDKESGGSVQPGPQQIPAAPEMDKESGGSAQPGPQQMPATQDTAKVGAAKVPCIIDAENDLPESAQSTSFTEGNAKNLDYSMKLPLTTAMVAPVRAYLSKPKLCVMSSTQKPSASPLLSTLKGGAMLGPLSYSPIRMDEDGDTNDALEQVHQSFMDHSFEDEHKEEEFCPFEVIYDDQTKGRRSLNLTTVQKIWDNNPLMRFESKVRGVYCLRLTVGSIVWVASAFDETNLEQFVAAATEASGTETTPCAKLEEFLSKMVNDFFKPYPTPVEVAYTPCAAKVTKRKRTKDLALDHRPPFDHMVSLALQQSSFDGIAVNDVHARISNVITKLQKKLSNALRFGRLSFLGIDPKLSTDIDF